MDVMLTPGSRTNKKTNKASNHSEFKMADITAPSNVRACEGGTALYGHAQYRRGVQLYTVTLERTRCKVLMGSWNLNKFWIFTRVTG